VKEVVTVVTSFGSSIEAVEWLSLAESSDVQRSPAANGVTTEAEESQFLRSVARKRLVKILQKKCHC
jgi:hypothetical protein